LNSKKIYIVRHGQTDFNLRGIVQGSGVDAPLNDNGKIQAQQLFKAYHHLPFDYIYTSALQRTQETVQAFIDLKIPHLSTPALNEISWGSMDGKIDTHQKDSVYWQMIAHWKEGQLDFKEGDGESPLDVVARLQPIIHEWEQSPAQHLLVCMHGRAIRILLSLLLSTPLKDMDKYTHANCCVYELEWKQNQWHLLAANVQKHLL
jgi:broad specificity phosphatase PhoE